MARKMKGKRHTKEREEESKNAQDQKVQKMKAKRNKKEKMLNCNYMKEKTRNGGKEEARK